MSKDSAEILIVLYVLLSVGSTVFLYRHSKRRQAAGKQVGVVGWLVAPLVLLLLAVLIYVVISSR